VHICLEWCFYWVTRSFAWQLLLPAALHCLPHPCLIPCKPSLPHTNLVPPLPAPPPLLLHSTRNLTAQRWYPTALTLPSGETYIPGGTWAQRPNGSWPKAMGADLYSHAWNSVRQVRLNPALQDAGLGNWYIGEAGGREGGREGVGGCSSLCRADFYIDRGEVTAACVLSTLSFNPSSPVLPPICPPTHPPTHCPQAPSCFQTAS
jgi:hypothetical protein